MALQLIVTLPFDETIDSICGGGNTTILNDRASLKLGTPLSFTRTVTMFVPGT